MKTTSSWKPQGNSRPRSELTPRAPSPGCQGCAALWPCLASTSQDDGEKGCQLNSQGQGGEATCPGQNATGQSWGGTPPSDF